MVDYCIGGVDNYDMIDNLTFQQCLNARMRCRGIAIICASLGCVGRLDGEERSWK